MDDNALIIINTVDRGRRKIALLLIIAIEPIITLTKLYYKQTHAILFVLAPVQYPSLHYYCSYGPTTSTAVHRRFAMFSRLPFISVTLCLGPHGDSRQMMN